MHFSRLVVDRRQCVRREVVDLDHLCDCLMRRCKLIALGLGDNALLYGLMPVANVGGAHPFGDILGTGDQHKRLLQPRHATVVIDMR